MTDSAALPDEVRSLKRLVQVATRLNSTLDLRELLQLIIGTNKDLLRAEDSSLLLLDQETGELMFEVVTSDPTGDLMRHRIPRGKGIAGWVAEHAETVSIDETSQDPRFYDQVDKTVGSDTRSMLAVPLLLKTEVIGVMEAINKQNATAFSPADVELAEALASLASVAIDNARMYAKLADAVVMARLSYRL
jgi:phosphoserine phosphatase RsbU/P